MDKKTCSKCGKEKALENYYTSKGKTRGQCKKCIIRQNVRHQQETRSWENRVIDKEARRAYMKVYCEKNKAKISENNRQFRLKNPDYYKEYARNQKLRPI